MSYAEVTSRGPKQTPEEAAAPQPPQLEVSDTTASSVSLVDVDTPSVRTVPSDYLEQEVQTETQAARIEREREREHDARAEADLAKKKTAVKAKKADNWIVTTLANMSDGASSALVATNVVALLGAVAWVAYQGFGLYERGRLSWKKAGVGLAVLGAAGAFESVFAGYLQKARGSKQ